MNEIVKTIRIALLKMFPPKKEIIVFLVDPVNVKMSTLLDAPPMKLLPWFIVLANLKGEPLQIIHTGVWVKWKQHEKQ